MKYAQILPTSRDPTNLYEGYDFLIVKPVQVDKLPDCSQSKVLDDRIDPNCEVKPNVIDAKKDLLALRKQKTIQQEELKKREEELALRE